MIDAPVGLDAASFEAHVRIEQVAQIAMGERDVIGSGGKNGPVRKAGDLHDCNPVMLVVIGEEGEHPVRVRNLGAEHGFVPFDHFVEARRAPNDMRELRRRDPPPALGKLGSSIFVGSHLLLIGNHGGHSVWRNR